MCSGQEMFQAEKQTALDLHAGALSKLGETLEVIRLLRRKKALRFQGARSNEEI